MKIKPVIKFFRAYIKSMRLYYSFVTGIAGWIGVSFYHWVATLEGPRGTHNLLRTVEEPVSPERMAIILVFLFLAWGINQIINDYLGLREDRINAPERPMVTGELHPGMAVSLSVFLMLIILLITWFFLEPIAVIPLVAGAVLNVVYEYAKAYGILGNITFGIMISMCGLFGFWAAGPLEVYWTKARISALALIAVMNGLMTYYTYFKDYTGDKLTGKNTIVVKYGLEKNKYIAIWASLLPSILFMIGFFGFDAFMIEINNIFIILGILTIFLQVYTGYLYYTNPKGEMTYYSLVTNFRACTCGQATIIALFNPILGLVLFLFAYVFVGFLFNSQINIRA